MKALSTATSVCRALFFPLSTTCMSPSRTSFLRSLCSQSCCAEELSWACSSSASLPPYVLYTHLEALTRIRPLHVIYCLPTTFLQQALVQKNHWVCVWRKILVPVSLHVYIYTQNPSSSSLYLLSQNGKRFTQCLDFCLLLHL